MIQCEKDIIAYLNLPSIPVKKWDGRSSFKYGVALLNLSFGGQSYAVASYDSERDKAPKVIKVFSLEPYTSFEIVSVVPEYMNTEGVDGWDLSEESKRAAEMLIEEASELEQEGVAEEMGALPESEYLYEHVHNDEEARAYIKAWNAQHGHKKSKVPHKHEDIVAKLTSMWINDNKKK